MQFFLVTWHLDIVIVRARETMMQLHVLVQIQAIVQARVTITPLHVPAQIQAIVQTRVTMTQ